MKHILISFSLLFPALLPAQTSPDLVTLEHGQFKLNGQDFYPMVMNYGNTVSHWPGNPADEQEIVTGSARSPRCNSEAGCDQDILEDFQEIRSMGFNTVRLALRLRYFPGDGQIDNNTQEPCDINDGWQIQLGNTVGYSDQLVQFQGFGYAIFGTNGGWYERYMPMYSPFDPETDSGTEKYFDHIQKLLDLAVIAGLKVILITCNGSRLWSEPPAEDNPYVLYLKQLGRKFTGHPAILAYDLYNEPGYFMQCDNENSRPKYNVCEYSNHWVDALHEFDPDHLITIGLWPDVDFSAWDPTVMPIDFISWHWYPMVKFGEGYSYEAAFKRYHGFVNYFSSVSPKPWIIGETGFRAEENALNGRDVPPFQDGTEAQQLDFARRSQKLVWDCGGSGYSWWEYKDPSPYLDLNPYCMGLLRFGSDWNHILGPNASGVDKPAVEAFRDYKPHLSPREGCPVVDNYFEPYDTDNPSTGTDPIVGTIIDQDGKPVEGAHVVAGFKYADLTPWGNDDCDDVDWGRYGIFRYTFTDADGSFSIAFPGPIIYPFPATDDPPIGFPYEECDVVAHPNPPWTAYPTHSSLDASAPGYEHKPLVQGVNVLRRLNFTREFDINNLWDMYTWTTPSEDDDLNGSRVISINGIDLDGTFTYDIHAWDEVHLTGNVHIQPVDDYLTHLYITPTSDQFDCAEFAEIENFQGRRSDTQKPHSSSFEHNRSAPQYSMDSEISLAVFPNPSQGIFQVVSARVDDYVGYSLIDLAGATILESSVPHAQIDLSALAVGSYILKVNGTESSAMFRIIRQ